MIRSTLNLSLECLGERVLPSVSSTIPTQLLAPLMQAHPARLSGTVLGEYSVKLPITETGSGYQMMTDVGTTYQFTATSRLPRLGNVTVIGTITTKVNTMYGHATGQLTLSSGQGQMTIEVTGPLQQGAARLPGRFTYQVISATGAFAGLKDHGVMSLYMAGNRAQPAAVPHGKCWMLFS